MQSECNLMNTKNNRLQTRICLRPLPCILLFVEPTSANWVAVVSLLGSVLGPVEHGLSDAGGFARGVGEGAWDGVKGTVSGVGHLAEGGYKLATDSHYREQAWNSALNDAKSAANFAATAVTDPGKAADEIGNTTSHTWHALETAYNEAAARGQGSEFLGQIFGQGAILAGTAVIPGGVEADAVEGVGDAGRADTLLGEAGKLTDAAKTTGQTGVAAKSVGAIEDAEEVASTGESAANTIARGKPYAFGTGTRSERAAVIIDRSAQALGRNDASGLVDNVVYDAAAGSPDFWVDPNTGDRTITLDPSTFRKTEAGQLVAGTHELIHAEQWEQALSRHAGNLAAARSEMFVPQISLRYAIREVQIERRALQSVDRLLGGLTPQQIGHSTRYIERWQAVVLRVTGRRVP
jgi:hypothetical protein